MRMLIPTLAVTAVTLLAGARANAQVSFGIQIGPPPPPRVYHVPPQPGPDYNWVEGYWYPQGSHYVWHNGYWTRPPYAGAYWVDPYYVGGRYFTGRWEGARGYVNHNHRWDHSRERDEHRGPHHEEHHR